MPAPLGASARAAGAAPESNTLVASPPPDAFDTEAAAPAPAVPEVHRPAYLHTSQQLAARVAQIARKNPELAKVEEFGRSSQGQPLQALTLTAPGGPANKPTLLVVAGQHARETANPEFAVDYAEHLASAYGQDANLTANLRMFKICIIPNLNPDGRDIFFQGFDGGDLSKLQQRTTAQGIDENRDWEGDGAAFGKIGTSSTPGSPTYAGKMPGDAPEVSAAMSFIRGLNPSMVLDLHSFGDDILYSPGPTAQASSDERAEFGLASYLGGPAGFQARNSGTDYPTAGELRAFGTSLGKPALTVETGAFPTDQSKPDFWLMPQNSFRPNEANVFGILNRALEALGDPTREPLGPSVQRIENDGGKVSALLAAADAHAPRVDKAELTVDPGGVAERVVPLTRDGDPRRSERFNIDLAKVPGLDLSKLPDGTPFIVQGVDSSGVKGAVLADFAKPPAAASA